LAPSISESSPAVQIESDNDADEFEVVAAGGVKNDEIPFFLRATTEELPADLGFLAERLQPAKNQVAGGPAVALQPSERVKRAYVLGRGAARLLRGEQTVQVRMPLKLGRSPVIYVVLRGRAASAQYPLTVRSFSDYKAHVFVDCERARPVHFDADSVSQAFRSEVEALAFSRGAGLSQIPV
jgi:hypothetical protein